jgi:threonine dehydrogenase-like Zn-dependent dehydrogenase
MTPIWYKQLVVVGSIDHGAHPSAIIGGASAGLDHSIDAALDVLARRAFPPDVLVTHEFPLEGYRDAVKAGLGKESSRAVKVTFRPNG